MCIVVYRMTSTGANGLFGRVIEFVAERETFNAYMERMEIFFQIFFPANSIVESTAEGSEEANRVVANRKRAMFLTEVCPEVYSTLSNLLAPAQPKDTPFADIVKVLETITILNYSKLRKASIFVLDIRNLENKSTNTYWLCKVGRPL